MIIGQFSSGCPRQPCKSRKITNWKMQGLDLRQPYILIVLCARKSQGLNIVFLQGKLLVLLPLLKTQRWLAIWRFKRKKRVCLYFSCNDNFVVNFPHFTMATKLVFFSWGGDGNQPILNLKIPCTVQAYISILGVSAAAQCLSTGASLRIPRHRPCEASEMLRVAILAPSIASMYNLQTSWW